MLINSTNECNHVEFISYTGKYPNLCSGVLTLLIDGKEVSFGHNYSIRDSWVTDGNYESFWVSGGRCGFTNNYADSYVEDDEWQIDINNIPEQYRKYAAEIDEVFNSNVPWGCCGGCL